MSTTKLRLFLKHISGNQTEITIDPFHPAHTGAFKTKIKAWNTAFNAGLPSWYDYIVDTEGAKLIKSAAGTTNAPITAAIIETEEKAVVK